MYSTLRSIQKLLNHHAQKQLTNTSILSIIFFSTVEILFLSEAFGYAVSAY